MKHTQGKWKYFESNGKKYVGIKEFGEVPVCMLLADEREGINPIVNGSLIAAAPDLLIACKVALSGIPIIGKSDLRDLLKRVIDQAEGVQS